MVLLVRNSPALVSIQRRQLFWRRQCRTLRPISEPLRPRTRVAPNTPTLRGEPLVAGTASGPLLHADVGLSFWGGVCSETGAIIDAHHPLHGELLASGVRVAPGVRLVW